MTSVVTADLGALLPRIAVRPPGPASRAMAARLAAVESRNVTYVSEDWPVFWQEAVGSNVVDVDGNVFIDLTSAFGVALLGHSSTPVREAIERGTRLIHGMGDIHPPAPKLELLEALTGIAPWPDARAILTTSGSEAVEAALKTAALASGRPGVLAFGGAYHGLTLGSLAATPRPHFRAPFESRLYGGVSFVPFPDPLRDERPGAEAVLEAVRGVLGRGAPNGDPIGSIIVEPVQARGGVRIPPAGFMEGLGVLAREHGALVIADEIFTGMGRCGTRFASERVGLQPDILVVGKALGGGMPISACLAEASVMDAWPPSDGEAIHTSTFLGHPLSCVAALAALTEIEAADVAARANALGSTLLEGLRERLTAAPGVLEVRGLGLLLGIEFVEADGTTPAAGRGARISEAALEAGLILLPGGDQGHVLELTPPVTLSPAQVDHVVDAVADLVELTP